jgi:hypothetical protein
VSSPLRTSELSRFGDHQPSSSGCQANGALERDSFMEVGSVIYCVITMYQSVTSNLALLLANATHAFYPWDILAQPPSQVHLGSYQQRVKVLVQ